jgi:protein involved in ribonucleotide reduction
MADYIALVNGYGAGTNGAQFWMEEGVMDFLNLREEDVEYISKDVQESVEKMSEEVHAD